MRAESDLPVSEETGTPNTRPSQSAAHHSARHARLALTVTFFVNGAVLSNWVPRIPAVQDHLGLSNGALGLALLGVAVGALISMPVAGALAARFGSRPVVTVSGLALCAGLPLPALATGPLTLWLALLVLGLANGALDVSMNAQGVAVQARAGRPILSSFHAAFSFGGLTGAITGGLAAGLGIVPLRHFVVVAAICAVAAFASSRGLMGARAEALAHPVVPTREPKTRRRLPRPSRRLLALGVVAFCCLLGEGAMGDWTAVYLKNTLHTGAGVAAAGFAAFSLTMTVGRLFGDHLTAGWGPVRLVRRGGVLVAVALGAGLLVGEPWAAIVGFGGVGAGLAAIVPVVFSAAGASGDLPAGPAIAAVSTLGYLGFLAGPPVIGLTAGVVTLTGALGIVVLMGGIIALLAGSVRPYQPSSP